MCILNAQSCKNEKNSSNYEYIKISEIKSSNYEFQKKISKIDFNFDDLQNLDIYRIYPPPNSLDPLKILTVEDWMEWENLFDSAWYNGPDSYYNWYKDKKEFRISGIHN